jgi:hypothetical protein
VSVLPVLRLRFAVHFRLPGRPRWNRRVAEEVRLPTWSFETAERGALVFVRSQEPLQGHEALARLFLHDDPATAGAPAIFEVGMRGRWTDAHEREPPLAAVQDWVDEAEALLVLLGAPRPHAHFLEAFRTRR